MPPRFGDVHIAAKMRDVMRKIAHGEINRVHPPDTFGHVSEIDEIAGTIKYRVPGSTQDLAASYGFGDPPDIGKPVRITGRAGSRYVVGMSAAVNLDDVITTTPGDVTGVAISDLTPASTPLSGDELAVVVQDGITRNVPVSEFGSGLVTKSGIYNDNWATATTVSGSFGGVPLAWPPLDLGDALLDLSGVTTVTVVEDGYYTFDVEVHDDNTTDAWVPQGVAFGPGPVRKGGNVGNSRMVSVQVNDTRGFSFTCPLLAGDSVEVTVAGGGTHHFALAAVVSKIS